MRKGIFLGFLIVVVVVFSFFFEPTTKNNDKNPIQQSPIEAASFLRTHFIDVGQADATLLQVNDQGEIMTILIDTGDWNRSDVVSYLQKENIENIDLIAITHPHADHIGQLDKIIESFSVGEVWMNGEISNSQVFANALKAIEKYEVDYYEPVAGEIFDIGDLTIEIIHPGDLTLGTNDNSIVMRVQYGDVVFLYTGDAERAAEEIMLSERANVSAHILHVGHHGSNTSSTGSFLEAVDAQTAIYSAGISNSYGHPNPEIIDRLKNRHMKVFGTDIDGTIVLETDGKNYQLVTENKQSLPAPLLSKSCIDINTASIEELQKIDHIGESSAKDLISLRPFTTIDELINISGIGIKRLENIKEQNLACIGG